MQNVNLNKTLLNVWKGGLECGNQQRQTSRPQAKNHWPGVSSRCRVWCAASATLFTNKTDIYQTFCSLSKEICNAALSHPQKWTNVSWTFWQLSKQAFLFWRCLKGTNLPNLRYHPLLGNEAPKVICSIFYWTWAAWDRQEWNPLPPICDFCCDKRTLNSQTSPTKTAEQETE